MKSVFAKRGAKVRLDDVSADPPKGASKEEARERLALLG
jgi:hypothetical protein